MEETIVIPSPNWYKSSVIAVSSDGWVIYGGPSRSLCVLIPVSCETSKDGRFIAHVVKQAHGEKIVSVDISPEWPEKRNILVGSSDGMVKQWSLVEVDNSLQAKCIQSHNIHQKEMEEVVGVGYCDSSKAVTLGNFGNIVRWDIKSNLVQAMPRLLKGTKPSCMSCSPHRCLIVAVGTKQGVVIVLDLNGGGRVLYKVRGQNDEILSVSWCPQYEVCLKKLVDFCEEESVLTKRLAKIREVGSKTKNHSGILKDLPDDSFDETIVEEDDTFDIYKDHEANEFGHKKYEPEEVLVKVAEKNAPEDDFLAECLRLKKDLLDRKNKEEETITGLVEALDNTHMKNVSSKCTSSSAVSNENSETEDIIKQEDASSHKHKNLLASIGKTGGLRIWSRSGKLVASCSIPIGQQKNKVTHSDVKWATVLWYKPDLLLIADGRSQLLKCNPLQINSKTKLRWKMIHNLHQSGLFCIASNAPRIQNTICQQDGEISNKIDEKCEINGNVNSDKWIIWTASQDRDVICYSVEKDEVIAYYKSCGSFIYAIEACPYDARRYAMSIGDGSVRLLEMDLSEDETKLNVTTVVSYFQNVQGKVLTVAWHPTEENLLAFATAESRVGLIDASQSKKRSATTLRPTAQRSIYSLSWGPDRQLFTCGGGEVTVYDTKHIDSEPWVLKVVWEQKVWKPCVVKYTSRGILVGSRDGAIAVLDLDTLQPVAASFVFGNIIHHVDWHPQQTSESCELSPLRDLIAVSSLDKIHTVNIIQYSEKDDGKTLTMWKALTGHNLPVHHVVWNPHRDNYLLSTSQDRTVRVWDVVAGTCVSVFSGHGAWTVGAAWSSFPAAWDSVLSGGADCCVRLWSSRDFPADLHQDDHGPKKEKKKKKKDKKADDTEENLEENMAIHATAIAKPKQRFLLPYVMSSMKLVTPEKFQEMAHRFLGTVPANGNDGHHRYMKIFGNTNDFNSILDSEFEWHLEKHRIEAAIMLLIFRGEMSAAMELASEKDYLCPFLISLAPCVSFKFWKDTMQLYVAQIERMMAKGDVEFIGRQVDYGGIQLRKAATLLSLHDVTSAVDHLSEAKMFLEAYMLARARHMDKLAEDVVRKWADYGARSGMLLLASFCHLVLDDPYQAAHQLAKTPNEENLKLAKELAQYAGQTTFVQFVEEKLQVLRENAGDENDLQTLPLKAELFTNEILDESKDVSDDEDCIDDVEPTP
ncbi:unnamed protein product [Leptidea sinapis]|uniref:Uncharacterized protein n=1 Tax=Leptidea sinapis TaxID=189913 RepID=A0A5E4PV34_9NEOP|nr:unnamed protein product [Leptidea sinapis]